jgi:hypothetical protein
MAQPDGILLAQAGKLAIIFAAFGLAALLMRRWWPGFSSLSAGAALLVIAFNLPQQAPSTASFRWAQYQLPASDPSAQLAFAQQLTVEAEVLAVSTSDPSWNDTLCQTLCEQFPYSLALQQDGQYQLFFSAYPIAPSVRRTVQLKLPAGDVYWTSDSLSAFPGQNALCWPSQQGASGLHWQAAASPEWHQRLNPLASGVTRWLLSKGCSLAQQYSLATLGIATEAACWEFQYQPIAG